MDFSLVSPFPQPSEENGFLAEHIRRLRESFRHWTGEEFVPPRMTDVEAARYLFGAPFALLSHDAAKDPILTYGNEVALGLFGLEWAELTAMPSRRTAEQAVREERDALLQAVRERGYSKGYEGVRIARGGRRFRIEQATLWNVRDESGVYAGQAALIKHWRFLD